MKACGYWGRDATRRSRPVEHPGCTKTSQWELGCSAENQSVERAKLMATDGLRSKWRFMRWVQGGGCVLALFLAPGCAGDAGQGGDRQADGAIVPAAATPEAVPTNATEVATQEADASPAEPAGTRGETPVREPDGQNAEGAAEVVAEVISEPRDEGFIAVDEPAEAIPETPSEPSSVPPAGQNAAPAATAEQLAAWAIPDVPQLELLACYDGFDNPFLSCLAVNRVGAAQFVAGGERLSLLAIDVAEPIYEFLQDAPRELKNFVLSVAISADGRLLAAGDQGGMVGVWEMDSHAWKNRWQAHDSRATHVALSPDGTTLATTSYSGEVRIWDVETAKQISAFSPTEREIQGMVFVPEKRLAVIGGSAGIWDLSAQKWAQPLVENTFGSGLAYSVKSGLLTFAGPDNEVHVFDVAENQSLGAFKGHTGPVDHADVSDDGELLATAGQDASVRIWHIPSGKTVQVMDACGSRVVGLGWSPEGILVIASENGRVRTWGNPAAAAASGIESILASSVEIAADETGRPGCSALLANTLDARSWPRLPDAKSMFEEFGSNYYFTKAGVDEAKAFYRHVFAAAGWQENSNPEQPQPQLTFQKGEHLATVSFQEGVGSGSPGTSSDLQIGLRYQGDYDLRWLPKHSDAAELEPYSTSGSAMYRTTDDISDVEVRWLERMHAAGWTAFTRLFSSNSEQPDRRLLGFVNGGIQAMVSLGYGAGDPGKLFVQSSAQVFNKSLPIPPDSGLIELDTSGPNLSMVANTKMDLNAAIAFYETEMKREGWLPRSHGRGVDDNLAWLPFIRGQQDVVIRLVGLQDAGTRIVVGEAERSSWQLKGEEAIDPELLEQGIEAADFILPKGAQDVQYQLDQKQIGLKIGGRSPQQLITGYTQQLAGSGWEQDSAGILDADYSFRTFKRGKAELSLRARPAEGGLTELTIDGDGLLWSKPPPAAPVRVSYPLWLERNRYPFGLERLELFRQEMNKIPFSPPQP